MVRKLKGTKAPGNQADIVLKTIYYAGSDSKKAAGEDDRFIEI